MPIYEYRCRKCGFEFDRILRMGSENPSCPECDSETDKRISLSDFKMKGQPPKRWKPLKKSNPKSNIPNMKYARRKS